MISCLQRSNKNFQKKVNPTFVSLYVDEQSYDGVVDDPQFAPELSVVDGARVVADVVDDDAELVDLASQDVHLLLHEAVADRAVCAPATKQPMSNNKPDSLRTRNKTGK